MPTDLAEYRRRRGWARLATTLVGAQVVAFVLQIVRVLRDGGDTRFGMVPYIGLLWLLLLAWLVVVPLWRRSFAARPVTLSTDPTAGEVYGTPELDQAPQRHRGLSRKETPPARW